MASFDVDWSPLATLANTYRLAQQRQAIAEAYPGSGGDITLAQLALASRRDERDYRFREHEAQRAQSNADRVFAFQKQQAADAAKGLDYREVDDGQGGKTLVAINRATQQVTRPEIGGVQTTPNNPFAQGKMTDEQSKAGLYSSRMFNAEKVLRDPASVAAATSLKEQDLSRIPIAGNYMVSESFQKYDQAQRDFINAVLRRESGAVISDSEFDNARKQYFPQPGDSAERIQQKQANRAEAIRGIAAGAGPGYRPENTFDPQGNIVPNPAPRRNEPKPQNAKGISKAEYDALPSGAPYTAPDGTQRTKK